MGLLTQPFLTRMALSYTKKTAQRCRQIASRSPTNLQQSQQGVVTFSSCLLQSTAGLPQPNDGPSLCAVGSRSQVVPAVRIHHAIGLIPGLTSDGSMLSQHCQTDSDLDLGCCSSASDGLSSAGCAEMKQHTDEHPRGGCLSVSLETERIVALPGGPATGPELVGGVAPVPETPVLLASAGKPAQLTVLVHRICNPVDARVLQQSK